VINSFSLRLKILISFFIIFILTILLLSLHEYSIRKSLTSIYINKYELLNRDINYEYNNRYVFPKEDEIKNNLKDITEKHLSSIKYLLNKKYPLNKKVEFIKEINNNDDPEWSVETTTFLNPDKLSDKFTPFALPNTFTSLENKNYFRILSVGDSFLVGNGVIDNDKILDNRLLELLNENFGNNYFENYKISDGGAGILEYEKWLSKGNIKAINPDIIIIFFYENDLMFCGRVDKDYCISENNSQTLPLKERFDISMYKECLSGENYLITRYAKFIINRFYPATYDKFIKYFCDESKFRIKLEPSDNNKNSRGLYYMIPELNLELEKFKKSIDNIKNNVGDIPIYILFMNDLNMPDYNYITNRGYPDLFEELGYIVAKPEHYKNFDELLNLSRDEICVNPSDCHYSPKIVDFYAKVALDLLKENSVKPKNNNFYQKNIISNTTPTFIPRDYITDNEVLIGYQDPRSSFHSSFIDRYTRYKKSGTTFYSLAPCKSIGRPHIRVSFDKLSSFGKNIKVELLNAENGRVTFTTFGYDQNGNEIIDELKEIRISEIIEFKYNNDRSGIIIGSLQSGCPIDKTILAPEILIKVSII